MLVSPALFVYSRFTGRRPGFTLQPGCMFHTRSVAQPISVRSVPQPGSSSGLQPGTSTQNPATDRTKVQLIV